MVKYQTSLDVTFLALADPTRRAILARLARSGASVSELAEPHDMSLPAVVKHLRVLGDAGLVVTEKTGRVRRCAIVAAPLRDAAEWIGFYRAFWEDQLAHLDAYLHRTTPRGRTRSGRRTARANAAHARPRSEGRRR